MVFKHAAGLIICASLVLSPAALAKDDKSTSDPSSARNALTLALAYDHSMDGKPGLKTQIRAASGAKIILPRPANFSGAYANAVTKFCTGESPADAGPEESALAASVVSYVFKKLLKRLFRFADSSIEKQLAAYRKEETFRLSAALFDVDDTGARSQRITCLRIVSGHYQAPTGPDEAVEAHLNFDLLAAIHPLKGGSAAVGFHGMQIIPLVLTTDQPDIIKADAVTFGLTTQITSLSRDGSDETLKEGDTLVLAAGRYGVQTVGRHGATFEQTTTVFQDLDADALGNGSVVPSHPILPLPGTSQKGMSQSGLVNMEFTLAQAGSGARKDRLEAWRKVLSSAEDKVSTALLEAITALLSTNAD